MLRVDGTATGTRFPIYRNFQRGATYSKVTIQAEVHFDTLLPPPGADDRRFIYISLNQRPEPTFGTYSKTHWFVECLKSNSIGDGFNFRSSTTSPAGSSVQTINNGDVVKIEMTPDTNVKFFINNVLKHTMTSFTDNQPGKEIDPCNLIMEIDFAALSFPTSTIAPIDSFAVDNAQVSVT